MKRLLITGASGFLGYNVCRAASSDGWNVYGAYLSHPLSIDKVKSVRLDLRDAGAVARSLEEIRPDAVIHCAAMPDPNICELKPEESYRVNVQASITLASVCGTAGCALVFTSTDLVFDGEHAPYRENDAIGPLNIYGKHKAEAEAGMRRVCPAVTICRTPLMFGDPGPFSKSSIQPLIANLRLGHEIKLFSDEFRTPVSGATAAQGLLLALGKPGETYHLGGRERISRYEFGRLLCRALGTDLSLVIPALQKENNAPAKRARDVSLVSDKVFAIGYGPKMIEEQLQELECVNTPGPSHRM
jgi:dTDP-4-dehydrorhamnose reductase